MLLCLLAFIGCKPNESNPNILIIFTDDQGYADLGCYGAEGFKTPNIDRLANDGMRFTDFYVPATVCTPSRAGLLTGRYPVRSNLHEAVVYPFSSHGLEQEEFTLAEMLKSSGYSTSIVGKWHLGHKPEYMPNNHGFDYFFGVPYSNDMDGHYYKHNDFQSPPLPLYRNQIIIEEGPDQKYLTRRYTEEVVKLIKNNSQGPFFIYLAHVMPHLPLHVSPDFQGKSEKGLYGDVIMEIDWSTGVIMNALKEEGLYDNTIIIYTSDNGPRVGSAHPLRGSKAQTWEGGQRVPGIISWPNKFSRGATSTGFVNTMDLFPTLANVVGYEVNDRLTLDGIDIGNHLISPEEETLPERPFFYFARNGKIEAVRMGDWKLHTSKTIGWSKESDGEFPLSLYNLKNNISEDINLVDKHPEIVGRLKEAIEKFENSMDKF